MDQDHYMIHQIGGDTRKKSTYRESSAGGMMVHGGEQEIIAAECPFLFRAQRPKFPLPAAN
jgi:hypothetical protein